MIVSIVAGLLLGTPIAEEAHRVQMDHRGQQVDVTYRSAVDVRHKQVGAVGAPGRPSALRCAWTASVDVHREARHAAGHVLTRRISADAPISGTRPGWCDAQRGAIAQEIAAKTGEVREHLLAVAERDQAAMLAELDAAHDRTRG